MDNNEFFADLDLGFDLVSATLLNLMGNPANEPTHYLIPSSERYTVLDTILAKQMLFVIHGEIFHTPPGQHIGIHRDRGLRGEHGSHSKLNWVWNGDGSLMHWYDAENGVELTTKQGTQYESFDDVDCKLVCSHAIAQPTLVNAGIPHNVVNLGNQHRWCLSLVLADPKTRKIVSFDDAAKRLQKYRIND